MKSGEFTINAVVTRIYVGPKVAFLTLDGAEEGDKFPDKHEVVFFGDGIALVASVKQGDRVSVHGDLGTTKVVGKDKQPILKDGFPIFVPQLVGRTLDKVGTIAGVEVLPPKAKLPF
jgi:hypothetical protein